MKSSSYIQGMGDEMKREILHNIREARHINPILFLQEINSNKTK